MSDRLAGPSRGAPQRHSSQFLSHRPCRFHFGFGLVAQGRTNAQLAEQPSLNVFTTQNQVIKVLPKFGLKNRSGVARKIALYVNRLVPLSEAKNLTGLRIAAVRRLSQEGQLDATRVGRTWFTTRQAIDSFISNRDVNQ